MKKERRSGKKKKKKKKKKRKVWFGGHLLDPLIFMIDDVPTLFAPEGHFPVFIAI